VRKPGLDVGLAGGFGFAHRGGRAANLGIEFRVRDFHVPLAQCLVKHAPIDGSLEHILAVPVDTLFASSRIMIFWPLITAATPGICLFLTGSL